MRAWGRALPWMMAMMALSVPAHALEALRLRPVFVIPELTLPEPSAAVGERAPAAPYPFLRGEETNRSISVGDTSNGYLVNGAHIVESEALAILPEQKARQLDYGSEELVAVLQHAAQTLHQASGTRLWIGNVAAEAGGDIAWSVSHNSGRDADIAFCYQSLAGEPVDPPDLIALNGQGLAASHPLKLDAARTWLVVKALLSSPAAQVQYLFIANGLRDQVLLAAQAAHDDPKLIQLAAAVMRQPVGSAPHNDHLHLRIYCGRRDVLGGCQNSGWFHPWTDNFDDDKRAAVTRIAKLLDDEAPAERRRALQRLALLDASAQAEAVAKRLDDADRDVREAAATALARLGGARQVPLLSEHFRRESDSGVQIALISTIGDLGGHAAGEFLAETVGTPRPPDAEVWSALDAAAHIRGPALLSLLPETMRALGAMDGADVGPQLAALAAASRAERLEPVPALIALLEDRDPLVRRMAAHALRMSTNLGYGIDWTRDDPTTLGRGRARWHAAWSRSSKAARASWLLTGFKAAGYRIPEFRQKHTWELVRATAGSDHISFNAQRVLMRLFDQHPPSLSWSKDDACLWWFKWIKRRRQSYKLESPPTKVLAACYNG